MSSPFDLTGKAGLVTGAAGWLGHATCLTLAECGASFLVADRDLERAEATAAACMEANPKADVRPQHFEARELDSQAAAVQAMIDAYGRIDFLVNGAYFSKGCPLEDLSPEIFDEALHTNVTSAFTLARSCVDHMPQGGSIVLFSSMYGQVAPDFGVYEKPMAPNPIEYGASKAAVEQMVRYLGAYWAPRGIRVNGIAPGPFPSSVIQERHPEFVERLAAKVPLGRIGTPEEVAAAVAFLVSPGAAYVNAHILSANGGWQAW